MRSWWTTHEIIKAIKEGYQILEMHKAIVYTKNLPFNPFKEYIETLYQIKLEGGMLSHTAKILLNGLTGKLAQTRMEYDQRIVHRSETHLYEDQGYKIVFLCIL